MYSLLLKIRINRGNRCRKIGLCTKGLLENNTNPQVIKSREKYMMLKIEPSICHLVISTLFFFRINYLKVWITLTVVKQNYEILLN